MKTKHLWALGTSALLAIALAAVDADQHPANAQTFPGAGGATAVYVPLLRASAPLGDNASAAAPPAGAGNARRDIVGNAANPAVFIASDANHLFFRLRVDSDPGTWANDGWGCVFDTDGTLTNYEFMTILDGERDVVSYRRNSTVGGDTTDNNAETELTSFNVATFARRVAAASNFGGDGDWFVDFAVPWATIRGGTFPVAAGTPMRFICGTTADSSSSQRLEADIANNGNGGPVQLSTNWSDAYLCNTGGDIRCVQCNATFLTNCAGATPACNVTAGTCAACDGNNGAATTAPCPSAASPACQTVPALAGQCTQCSATFTGLCSGATPTCDVSTGSCAACNGDNGSGAARACPTAATPICQIGGALNGQCTECAAGKTAACTGATPTCDVATGTCTGCNGDNGSGATRPCGAALPACNTSGPLLGICTQCKVGLTTQCVGGTPACSTVTGACVACNGHNGSGATAACPSAAAPACHAAGVLAGRCTVCSANNQALCVGATPACDVATGVCAPCNGDRGTPNTHACPDAAAPYCNADGTCGKCTNSNQCGGVHAGPTCDIPTGACVDVDTDGDGVQDALEIQFGTNPNKKDSDDDGIPDGVELLPVGVPIGSGQFAKVDTDGDGTIDALDTDSDNDGLLDKDEVNLGDAGVLLSDTDNDGTPNFRDDDDDNDLIKTKDELADTKASGVSNDVDNDGKVNWLDSDADGDGEIDGFEGRGDTDGDGIPNYLDPIKDPPKVDAGPIVDSGPPPVSTSSSSSSSGNVTDAAPPAAPNDQGVLQGTGLFCGSTVGSSSGAPGALIVVALGSIAGALVSRRRRHRGR